MNPFSRSLVLALLVSCSVALADPGSEPEAAVEQAVSVMDVPLDGSSVESFTAGLTRVDEEATEDEYRKLMSALDFMLFYDVGARRNKARLYARLDGKTPNDILSSVAKNRSQN